MKINLISECNGVGLSSDIDILRLLLADHDVEHHLSGGTGYRRADVNVFLERVGPKWLDLANVNILIPNPEWYRDKWRPFLHRFDLILCKSREAETIYRAFDCNAIYLSWTSKDQYRPTKKRNDRWLHLAGRSSHKGTHVVADCWRQNPDFPNLTIIQSPNVATANYIESSNITWIREYVPAERVQTLQNECGVHVCPSEMEGFGHYINEALSAGSAVITTDAAPMNEIAKWSTGALVDVGPGS